MAEETYRDYLAARVLTENKPVTYRLLSRALKVDVNSAKRMLYEFHSTQNARKPNSIHATYLIAGRKRKSEHTNGLNARNGGDVDMRSSPFMSSMPEPAEEEPVQEVKETTILLVREEELQKTRADFEEETSIHVYSLEPGPLETLGILATCNHECITEYTEVDPLERWKVYGAIHNAHIKRRTGKGVPPAAATSKPAPKSDAKPPAKAAIASQPKKDVATLVRQGSAPEDNTSGRSTPQPSNTLKRSDSKSGAKKSQTAGDLFKSFAKSKPKSKDAEKSKESTPAPDDEPMGGMSEDEGDADDAPEVVVDGAKNEASRKAREERQEKLRKMMEDDDEDMLDAPVEAESQPDQSLVADADTPEPSQGEATVSVENGRRRGKRRVMKKKKVKDEDGYLVTKEEAVWESFSEDEPQPKKPKPAPPKPASSAKGKPAGKKGQGSIASFFKKA
ncbi:DNA polymerase subunit Cdc27 [Phaeosphaeria sp. MPI-PUGE-AT-0046c]|nr:DNA polymerase subunit Cdc27 [Phaeosphaeria sp. MPI-PUGE-AT-0046c]